MSLYRGAGGAGDAVADSASEALLVRELAIEVQADADAAAASATAAANSASTASTAATNAQTAETNAETAETNAETAEANAETAQAAAEAAQLAAETAQTAAELAETNAETAETNAETAATNAASSASAASTSATNASNSASAASTSATNASNSASSASTSASNASTSATAAASSASAASTSASNAATSETNAAASASSASTSASTATTQAGIATTQATNAASSASAASTSASNASSSASAASTSASNAATSATNAGNSATAAATSETNAAASAAAAAASYDNFDDRYLGSKSAAPTVDNDGNTLLTGALYYNNGTVTPADKGMYVYDGTQWIAASAASTAILTVFRYTATASQTTFTGADDNSLTLTYTAGSVLITVNGAVMEVGVDVTASNGTSIVLAQAALAGDEVNIYAFATFNIANTYTQAEADARFFNVTGDSISGNLTFTGTGNRIAGDFSNATVSNRVILQTSTTNGNTFVEAIPNGTSQTAGFNFSNNSSDPANTSFGGLLVGSGDVRFQSSFRGTGSYLPMTFHTGGSETARFSQTAKTLILAGGSTSSNGTGITFPATQSASSDANTLDDYEEGTFTPTIDSGITSPVYATQTGTYTKVGRLVSFSLRVGLSGGTATTGRVQIGSLPFTSNTSGTYLSGAYFVYVSASVVNSVTTNLPTLFINNSSNVVEFWKTDGAGFQGTQLTSVGGADFYINGSYFTN